MHHCVLIFFQVLAISPGLRLYSHASLCFDFRQVSSAGSLAERTRAEDGQPVRPSGRGIESRPGRDPSTGPPPSTDDVPGLEVILDNFTKHLLPTSPTPGKSKEAKQCRERVSRWCYWMCGDRATHLEGLTRWETWARWIESLHLSLAPTTVSNHLIDYTRFLRYLKLGFPPAAGLSANEMDLIATWVVNERSSLRQKIREHRFTMLERKTASLVSGRELAKFIDNAREAIPASLRALASDPRRLANVTQSAGLLAAYMLSYTGTRKSCIVALETTDVLTAALVRGSNDGSRILRLGKHKTSSVYGPARMALSGAEYGWLMDFVGKRRMMRGYTPANKLVFFNTQGKPMEKITAHIRAAYARVIGRRGVTATSLRTAVATLSARTMSPDEQLHRARQMGQTCKTRNSHYVALESADELLSARWALERAFRAREGTHVAGEERQPYVAVERSQLAESLVRAERKR